MRYYIKGNIKDITSLLKVYHPKVWNRLSSRIADLFFDLASTTSKDTEFAQETGVNQRKRDQLEGEEHEKDN